MADEVMKQIIALGGGGFSMEPDNLVLDSYILEQCEIETPKICFLPTASGDADDYVISFFDAFNQLDCEPTELSLYWSRHTCLREFLLSQDIIYVGGGNTKNMLALWREWHVDAILKEAYHKGILLTGISAGSICWFESGLSDSFGGRLAPLNGLGLLKGSNCPHYNNEENRLEAYQSAIKNGELVGGYACDDSVALHFLNGDFYQAVSSDQEAGAFQVSQKNGGIVEERLKTLMLD